MKILFAHANFPAQFRDLALVCARDPHTEVVFLTARAQRELPQVRKILYTPAPGDGPSPHPYLRGVDSAIRHGQAAYRAAAELKRSGWGPDVIYGHSGFGPMMFLKDLFPHVPVLGHFEWYYRAEGGDANFLDPETRTADSDAAIRIKNTPILSELVSCDAGCTPTHWQRAQFPAEFHPKLEVIHEGIDTIFFEPTRRPLVLPKLGLDLTGAQEVITYVARGLEPYRGFPQFMAAAELLQRERPGCHVVVVGEDRCAYGRTRSDGRTHVAAAREDLSLDPARTHFTGPLSYPDYRAVLQASSVHVYLTVPFVLSWSLLEAMASGCNVVAADTPPVREVITEGEQGLLADFFDPAAIATRIAEALAQPEAGALRRVRARERIEQYYALRHLLPKKLRWIQSKCLTSKH